MNNGSGNKLAVHGSKVLGSKEEYLVDDLVLLLYLLGAEQGVHGRRVEHVGEVGELFGGVLA